MSVNKCVYVYAFMAFDDGPETLFSAVFFFALNVFVLVFLIRVIRGCIWS